jgi:hypothetical protein
VDSSSSGAAAVVAPARVRAKPKRKALWILLPIGLLVVYWLANHRTDAQPSQPVTKQKRIQTISNPALPVKATGNSHFKLEVPSGADNVHLWANFIARGGTDDNIEAWVFSDEEFMNWQNGNPQRSSTVAARSQLENLTSIFLLIAEPIISYSTTHLRSSLRRLSE